MAAKKTGSANSRTPKPRNRKRTATKREGAATASAADSNPTSLPGVDAAGGSGAYESAGSDVATGDVEAGSVDAGRARASRRAGGASAKGGGLRDRVAALGEYGSALGQRSRESLSRAGSAVRSGASVVGHAAKDGLERGREITVQGWESHPLAVCGAALALGAIAGILLPSTRVEDQMMGEAADRVNNRLRQAADGLVEQGKSVVGRAVSEATTATAREAEHEGLTPERIGRKVKRLVGHVRQAVAEAVDGK